MKRNTFICCDVIQTKQSVMWMWWTKWEMNKPWTSCLTRGGGATEWGKEVQRACSGLADQIKRLPLKLSKCCRNARGEMHANWAADSWKLLLELIIHYKWPLKYRSDNHLGSNGLAFIFCQMMQSYLNHCKIFAGIQRNTQPSKK